MAKCKYCGKRGIFLSVSKDGLCKRCQPAVALSIHSIVKVISESQEIVNRTKNFNTAMSRLDLMEEQIKSLNREYLSKGIKAIKQSPEQLLKDINKQRKTIVQEEVLARVNKHMDKAFLSKTLASKLNNANKALLELKEFQDRYGYHNEEKAIEIIKYIHQTELDDLMLKAEKEEFKGNINKAIDKYQDVLFFLKKDGIEDSFQSDIIKKIGDKINSLNSRKLEANSK